MKKYIFTIILITFFILPASAVKKLEANPINIAVSLVEKTDSLMIVSDLNYYGYIPQQSNKGYTEFHHSNGSVINFMMPSFKTKGEYPTIEVKCKTRGSETENILKDLRFKKVENGYERNNSKYDKYITRCKNGPSGKLIIRRIRKEITE